jgi:hypothetical protein
MDAPRMRMRMRGDHREEAEADVASAVCFLYLWDAGQLQGAGYVIQRGNGTGI